MQTVEAQSKRLDRQVRTAFMQFATGPIPRAHLQGLGRVAVGTCFAVAALFCLPCHANDIEPLKPQFKTREEQIRYREAALDHFRTVCREKAGEIVHRVVENVDGILLKTPQRRPSDFSLRDQYWKADWYGVVLYPPAEISRYLFDLDDNSIPTVIPTSRSGYAFVETPNSNGSGFVVHRRGTNRDSVVAEVSQTRRSRYGVVREDISTERDRSYWVAGGRLAVIDLSTGSVLGERIGYVLEAGFGSTAGGRRPWLIAQRNACPPIPRNAAIDRLFVQKVLRPAAQEHLAK